MKNYDASGAHPNHTGWPDGFHNIPAEWNLARMRTLYQQNFGQPNGTLDLPDDNAIKAAAMDSAGDPVVCIDIEGWRLFLPETWSWKNWDKMRPEYRDRAGSAEAWNTMIVEQYVHVLKKFRKHNKTSKVGWFNVPTTSNLYEIYWRDDRGYRDPPSTHEYHGYIGTEIWAWSQIAEYVDFGVLNGYWSKDRIPHGDDFTIDDWRANITHGKAVADAALDAPVVVFMMIRKENYPGRHYYDPATLRAMLDHLRVVLQPDDGVALWEGSSSNMQATDDELANFNGNEYWINAFGEFFTG